MVTTGNNLGQVVHTRVSLFAKWHNLVPVKWRDTLQLGR